MEPSVSGSGVNKYSILPDPLNDRSVKTLEPPVNRPLDNAALFNAQGVLQALTFV